MNAGSILDYPQRDDRFQKHRHFRVSLKKMLRPNSAIFAFAQKACSSAHSTTAKSPAEEILNSSPFDYKFSHLEPTGTPQPVQASHPFPAVYPLFVDVVILSPLTMSRQTEESLYSSW